MQPVTMILTIVLLLWVFFYVWKF